MILHRLTRLRKALSLSTLSVAALTIAGCARYAVVSERNPQYAASAGAPAECQECIANGTRQAGSKPLVALGEYLTAANVAAQHLRSNPKNVAARDAYNFALARAFTIIERKKLDPWTQPLRVPARGGDYLLTTRPARNKLWAPQLYAFTPADQFDVKGLYVSERTTKAGLGAPLVAVGRTERKDTKENFALKHTYYGITAVAHFETGRRCVIAFEDPLGTEDITLGGRSYPLAADFTVPLAVMLNKEKPEKLELARLLSPGKYAETAHIVRLEPYRPEKIPVVVVHGLMDSPATWTAMINKLRADPAIRQKYQFWYYSYPSGYPYPYSAAIMRRELDRIQQRYAGSKPIVLIGHSMGSLVSRLMVTDSGDKIWMHTFGKRPEEMKLDGETREMLEESLIFRRRKEVSRVIFIAAPHRGSDLAGNWLGRFGSFLVRAPSNLMKVAHDAKHLVQADPSALKVTHIPNSVDTLAPNNRFVKLINTIPISAAVPYHSIIGDRGRGDSPNSSDGFVPYWSSHMEGAKSELIVPSNHSAQRNPEAIAEVNRILKLHAKM